MKIDIIIPSYRSPLLTLLAVDSFEKFKGEFSPRYIIYENSEEDFSKDVKAISDNFLFLNDPKGNGGGSWDNGHSIENSKPHIEADYVFVCHSDTIALKHNWLADFLAKHQAGNRLVGFRRDNGRIHALHASGFFLDTNLLLASNSMCTLNEDGSMIMDSGDNYTDYCRKNNLNYYKFRSTFNEEEEVIPLLSHPFNQPSHYKNGIARYYDIAINDDNDPIFSHLGRGSCQPSRHDRWFWFARMSLGAA